MSEPTVQPTQRTQEFLAPNRLERLLGKPILFPGEEEKQREAVEQSLVEELKPRSFLQRCMIRHIANALFDIERFRRDEQRLLECYTDDTVDDILRRAGHRIGHREVECLRRAWAQADQEGMERLRDIASESLALEDAIQTRTLVLHLDQFGKIVALRENAQKQLQRLVSQYRDLASPPVIENREKLPSDANTRG